MARREPDDFDGQEAVLVYVARKVRHATTVEALLTEAGVDYVVETDTFAVGFIFRAERVGAFFYVAPGDQGKATDVLSRQGFTFKVG